MILWEHLIKGGAKFNIYGKSKFQVLSSFIKFINMWVFNFFVNLWHWWNKFIYQGQERPSRFAIGRTIYDNKKLKKMCNKCFNSSFKIIVRKS